MSTRFTYSLADRCQFSLYVVVLTATATYAYTSQDATSFALAGAACAVAWLLGGAVSGPTPSEPPPAPRAPLPRRAASWFRWGRRKPPADVPAGQPLRSGWVFFLARLISNLVVLAAAVSLATRVYFDFNGTRNFILELDGFLVVLAVCKLFEGRSVRNTAQILTLALLLVVSTTMFSNSSLAYFILLGGFFVLLFYNIMVLNLLLESQTPGAVRPEVPSITSATQGPRGAARRALPVQLGRDLAAVIRHCMFLVLPVAITIFALVPRTRANPLLANSWGGGPVQTGFSETVQFRDRESLVPSDAEVMRVKLYRSGEDAGSEFSDLYFRGAVLNEYDDSDQTWSHAPGGPVSLVTAMPGSPGAFYPFAPEITATFTVSHPGRTLFVLAPFAPSRQSTHQGLTYNPDEMILHNNYPPASWQGALSYSGAWLRDSQPEISPDAAQAHVRFDFTGSWMQRLLRSDPRPRYYCPAGQLRHWRLDYSAFGHLLRDAHGWPKFKSSVEVPPAVQQMAYAILARDMGADAPRPGQLVPLDQFVRVANVFCTYLRQNYRYSLTSHPSDPRLDYTADFLLHRGIKDDDIGGPCTYFASAMVMLCRSVGINARMVAGYHGAEFNTYSSEFIVKEKYAHAWAEVYMPDQGWTLYDATPVGNNLDTAGASGHFFSDVLQMLQSVWSTTIINFDNDSRAAIASAFTSLWDWLLDEVHYPPWTPVFMGVALAGLLALQIFLRRHFRRHPQLPKPVQRLAQRQARRRTLRVGFLEELLALFQRRATRAPDQTPLEFLRPHLPELGPAAADARWLVQTAYGIRFGDLPLNAPLRQRIAHALKNVKAAHRAPSPPPSG